MLVGFIIFLKAHYYYKMKSHDSCLENIGGLGMSLSYSCIFAFQSPNFSGYGREICQLKFLTPSSRYACQKPGEIRRLLFFWDMAQYSLVDIYQVSH
jgi:hypothetical protein